MIRHIVSWGLSSEDPAQRDADAEGVRSRLEALNGVVPGLRSLTVGRDLGDTDGNWDLVLVSEHDDRAALEAYQSHPEHLAAVAFVKSVVARRSAVDVEL